ncbi:MAG TPA: DUF2568 domain-containing protein [Solirubrobacteraceae bacterium]|nr:DUF2568 domain-containing protein [Solirubrobacteraceae bacterium]
MRVFSLALKFLLELAAFATFAYWGASVSIVLAIAAPAVAIVLWGLFAAPRSERRLAMPARIAFETGVFLLAVVALLAVGATVAAIVLAALVAISTALLTRFDQWEA